MRSLSTCIGILAFSLQVFINSLSISIPSADAHTFRSIMIARTLHAKMHDRSGSNADEKAEIASFSRQLALLMALEGDEAEIGKGKHARASRNSEDVVTGEGVVATEMR